MFVKLIMLGDTCVGKTSFVRKFIHNNIPNAHTPTIGAAMSSKRINRNNFYFDMHIWDTAGQERYSSLTTLYYKSSNIAIIMYDITNRYSFSRAQKYIYSVKENGPDDIVIGLIGNKNDIAINDPKKRAVTYSTGKEFADFHNIWFAETNVFNINDVPCVFNTLIDMLPEHTFNSQDTLHDIILDNKNITQNGCCIIS